MTRSLALEWGYYGIRVVGVAPGFTADTTGLIRSHIHQPAYVLSCTWSDLAAGQHSIGSYIHSISH